MYVRPERFNAVVYNANGGSRRFEIHLRRRKNGRFRVAEGDAGGSRQSRTNEQTQLLSLVCNRPIPPTSGGSGADVLVQRVAQQIAGRWPGDGAAVMTAVLREAGLNQYPDIERVSDTLTIPDLGCRTFERARAVRHRNEKRRWRVQRD